MQNLLSPFRKTSWDTLESISEKSKLRSFLEDIYGRRPKPPQSVLWRCLHYWKWNPKTRLAVGIGLLTGWMLATATGALGAAGIILGARAGISALGAFTTSNGLYDLLARKQAPNEIRKLVEQAQSVENTAELEKLILECETAENSGKLQEKVAQYQKSQRAHAIQKTIIATTAASVFGILGLHHTQEILAGAVASPLPASALSVQSPVATDAVSTIHPDWSVDMGKLASDIRNDHPEQGYITLEQMIRRVEGLRHAIPLEESERLSALNQSVSNLVHEPTGSVAQILRTRGFPVDRLGVEWVCRKLSESQIKEITQEYVKMTTPANITGAVTVDGPVFPAVSNNPTSLDSKKTLIAAGWAGILGGLALAWRKLWGNGGFESSHSRQQTRYRSSAERPEFQNNRSNEGSRVQAQDVRNPTAEIRNPEPGAERKNELKIPEPVSSENKYQFPREQLRVRNEIESLFLNRFGWSRIPESDFISRDKKVEVYEGNTLWGGYQTYVTYSVHGVQTTIIWYDHGTARAHVQSPVISNAKLSNRIGRDGMKKEMETLYFEVLEKRESLKTDDLTQIHSVRIPKGHLKLMYDHLDQATVRQNESEVLGYWISDAYGIHDGILPLNTLANPDLSEQVVTAESCRPKNDEVNYRYNYLFPNRYISQALPEIEAELILKARNKSLETQRQVIFTSAGCTHNWHKHPSGINRPSGGDISEAKKDIDLQFPNRKSYLYTIAVPITEPEMKKLEKNKTALVLSAQKNGGVKNYALRSFIVNYSRWGRPDVRELKIELKE